MALSDLEVKKAKPGPKAARLFDGGGLYMEVTPSGGKLWRLKYRYGGKEKLLALGKYPDVSLKDARERRDDARRLLANEIDPGENRKVQKAAKTERAANSFEVVAREWIAKNTPTWAATHTSKIVRRLEMYVFPWLGGRPIAEIAPPELLTVARRVEDAGAVETAHRILQNCGQVFRYGVATGRVTSDPTRDLRGKSGALQSVAPKHMAAVTEPHKVAELLRIFDTYQGTLTVRCALQLAPLVFVRPGELRQAEWKDVDLDAAEWRYIASKKGNAHIVPLSLQAVATLRELHALTGTGRYVFPSARTGERPMSDNAVLAAMRRLGVAKDEMSGHGFRAMARTILDEVLGFRPDLIEHQLPCRARPERESLQPHRPPTRAPQDDARMGLLPGQAESGGRGDTHSRQQRRLSHNASFFVRG